MHKATLMITMVATAAMLGCGIIPGLGDKDEAPPAQPIAMPVQPGMPGQPAAMQPGMPGQPGLMPTQPGMVPQAAPVAVPVPPIPTGDALIDALNAKKFLVAPQWQPTSALSKARLDNGAKQAYQVQLPGPPYCHTYIAVAETGLTNLDLSLTNAAGAVETQDATVEPAALVQNHCPAMAGMYTVTLTATQGVGEVAVQIFSK